MKATTSTLAAELKAESDGIVQRAKAARLRARGPMSLSEAAASIAPSAPDVGALVARLKEYADQHPVDYGSVLCAEAASALSALKAERDKACKAGRKLVTQAMEAEADRDRMAQENERLREECALEHDSRMRLADMFEDVERQLETARTALTIANTTAANLHSEINKLRVALATARGVLMAGREARWDVAQNAIAAITRALGEGRGEAGEGQSL